MDAPPMTPEANDAQPARSHAAPCSAEYYEIGLVGGTVLRIRPGRGKGCAYDNLLAALAGSKTHDGEEWQDEWMSYAKTIRLDEIPPSPPNEKVSHAG